MHRVGAQSRAQGPHKTMTLKPEFKFNSTRSHPRTTLTQNERKQFFNIYNKCFNSNVQWYLQLQKRRIYLSPWDMDKWLKYHKESVFQMSFPPATLVFLTSARCLCHQRLHYNLQRTSFLGAKERFSYHMLDSLKPWCAMTTFYCDL